MAPARPWFGGSEKLSKYTNGVLLLSFVQILAIDNIFTMISWVSSFQYPENYHIFVLIFVMLTILNTYWIIIRGSGDRFISNFDSFGIAHKRALLISSVLFTLFGLGGFWIIRP